MGTPFVPVISHVLVRKASFSVDKDRLSHNVNWERHGTRPRFPRYKAKIGFVEDIQEVLAVLVSRPVVCHAVGERTGVNSALGIAPTTKVSSSKPPQET
jgi:hypothetical protein